MPDADYRLASPALRLDKGLSQREKHNPPVGRNAVDDHDLVVLTHSTELPFANNADAPNLHQFQSPFEWPSSRKRLALAFCTLSTFLAAYSAGSYSISSVPLRDRFDVSSEAFATGITAWCVGFACSPMVLAPFSELKGRKPVFLFSGYLFFVSTIGCAVTNSFAGMIVARFFVGAGASTFATLCGGVLSDIYHTEQRNTPMAIYSSGALGGTGVGPLICGFIVGRTSWRWVFWHQVIAHGILMVAMTLFFPETRGSILLARKARAINQYLDQARDRHADGTGASNVRYTLPPSAVPLSINQLLYLSLTTPFKLLFTEPVVFFFSIWAAFAWGTLYLQLNVLPLVFSTNHGFSTQEQGAVFASLVVGVLIAVTISIYQEKLARRYRPKLLEAPEGRLYFTCLEAALLPIGLFWFGWSSFSRIHWIVPCLGATCAMVGIFSVYLSVFNYLSDVYHRQASSALACQSFCRNMLAAIFPLFSEIMFSDLGFPAASSLLGGVAALLTVVPWVLVFKGEAIRARSKIASEIVHATS